MESGTCHLPRFAHNQRPGREAPLLSLPQQAFRRRQKSHIAGATGARSFLVFLPVDRPCLGFSLLKLSLHVSVPTVVLLRRLGKMVSSACVFASHLTPGVCPAFP